MTGTDYAAALQPRRRYGPTLMVCAVCAAVAWLGWCGVLAVRAQRDATIGKACADVGYAWSFGECRAPNIELHMAPPARPAEPPAPWSSPLGPGGL